MGKDLNGKELPDGIVQLKTKMYKGAVMYHGIRKQCYSMDLNKCKQRLADIRYELTHNMIVDGSKMAVKAYADTFIVYKSKAVKKGTMNAYTDVLDKYILPSFGMFRLEDVRKDMLRDWIYGLADTKSNSTIHLVWSVASSLFSQAFCDNYIKSNPCDGIKLPKAKVKKTSAVFENEEQVKTFLANLYGEEEVFRLMCRFVMLTGLRSGEVRSLMWKDYDARLKELSVNTTLLPDGSLDTAKTETSNRVIPLCEEAVSILMALKSKITVFDITGNSFIFQRDGMPLTASYVACAMKRVVKECGVGFPNITIHSLRHYFGTVCANNGMPPKVLMSIMGHASITITMDLYAHNQAEANKAELNSVAACL